MVKSLDLSRWENPQSNWPFSDRQAKAFKFTYVGLLREEDYDTDHCLVWQKFGRD
jgi:hypothetical protein